jgi:hypothetical protein
MLVFAGSAFSQSGAEIFGGYSYQRTGDEGLNGFGTSVTGNITPWVGITGEFDLHTYGTSVIAPNSNLFINADGKMMAFRFGPRFTSHVNDTTSFFVHGLVGGYRASVSVEAPGLNVGVNSSGTGVSGAAGGGLDVRVTPKIALRPVQMDWIYLGTTSVFGVDTNNRNGFRYSGGVVVRF